MKEAFWQQLNSHKLTLAFVGSLSSVVTGSATHYVVNEALTTPPSPQRPLLSMVSKSVDVLGKKPIGVVASGLIIFGGLAGMSIASRKMDDWGWTPQSSFGSEDFQ